MTTRSSSPQPFARVPSAATSIGATKAELTTQDIIHAIEDLVAIKAELRLALQRASSCDNERLKVEQELFQIARLAQDREVKCVELVRELNASRENQQYERVQSEAEIFRLTNIIVERDRSIANLERELNLARHANWDYIRNELQLTIELQEYRTKIKNLEEKLVSNSVEKNAVATTTLERKTESVDSKSTVHHVTENGKELSSKKTEQYSVEILSAGEKGRVVPASDDRSQVPSQLQEKIALLENELMVSRQQCSDSVSEICKQREQCANILKTAEQKYRARIDKLEAGIHSSKEHTSNSSIATLEISVRTLKQDLATLVEENSRLKQRISTLEYESSAPRHRHLSELEEVEKRLAEEKQHVSSMQRKLDRDKEESNCVLQRTESTAHELKARCRKLESRLHGLHQQLHTASQHAEQLTAEKSKLTREVSTLSLKLSSAVEECPDRPKRGPAEARAARERGSAQDGGGDGAAGCDGEQQREAHDGVRIAPCDHRGSSPGPAGDDTGESDTAGRPRCRRAVCI